MTTALYERYTNRGAVGPGVLSRTCGVRALRRPSPGLSPCETSPCSCHVIEGSSLRIPALLKNPSKGAGLRLGRGRKAVLRLYLKRKKLPLAQKIWCSRQTRPMSKPLRREATRGPGQERDHVPTAQGGAVHVWCQAPLRQAGHCCPLCCCWPWPPRQRAALIIDVRCLQRGPPPPRKAPDNK